MVGDIYIYIYMQQHKTVGCWFSLRFMWRYMQQTVQYGRERERERESNINTIYNGE